MGAMSSSCATLFRAQECASSATLYRTHKRKYYAREGQRVRSGQKMAPSAGARAFTRAICTSRCARNINVEDAVRSMLRAPTVIGIPPQVRLTHRTLRRRSRVRPTSRPIPSPNQSNYRNAQTGAIHRPVGAPTCSPLPPATVTGPPVGFEKPIRRFVTRPAPKTPKTRRQKRTWSGDAFRGIGTEAGAEDC